VIPLEHRDVWRTISWYCGDCVADDIVARLGARPDAAEALRLCEATLRLLDKSGDAAREELYALVQRTWDPAARWCPNWARWARRVAGS
jgi:hypothetical protein